MGEGTGRRVVGVVGGGPLCLLFAAETRRKGLPFDIITVDSAAGAEIFTVGIEQPDGALLDALERSGKSVHPSPATLRTIQDRLLRKTFLQSRGLPVADFPPVDVAMEICVSAVRGTTGEIRCYPAAELLRGDGLLQTTIVPARMDPAAARAAEELAHETLKALQGAGVFGIEMVVDRAGGIFIEDILPRVHSAGHYTIEACRTSQFEQQVRAITGLPLGETTLLYSAVTVHLAGAAELQGPVVFQGLEGVREIPGVSVHLYGLQETAPRRPLGHVTLVDVNDPGYRDALVQRADRVRHMIVQKGVKR